MNRHFFFLATTRDKPSKYVIRLMRSSDKDEAAAGMILDSQLYHIIFPLFQFFTIEYFLLLLLLFIVRDH
jgi:hypothetical protein